MKTQTAIVLGLAGGYAYFQLEEATIPTDANCSYLASPLTDLLAVIGGAYGVYAGSKLGSAGVAGFGAAVIGIHIMQYLSHKRRVEQG